MTCSVEQSAYVDQLEYAEEQWDVWSHLPLEDAYEQIEAHLESEFGYVEPGVIGDALFAVGAL